MLMACRAFDTFRDFYEVPRRPDTGTLDLARAAQVRSIGGVKSSRDAHILRITDRAGRSRALQTLEPMVWRS